MYFNFKTFFRMAYLSFFKWRSTPARLTPKRIFFLVGFFLTFPIVQLFNAICLLLDEVLFPGYRKVELKKPVFILGNPRSGTTLIYRIMARDEQFYCFRTWEIMFPAIIQKKFISLIGRIDRMMGSLVKKCIKSFEARLFHKFNKMHQTSLFYPEEDEMLLIHIFSSLYLMWFFPFDELAWTIRFDEACRHEDRKRIMTFYKNCVKRQAFFKGGRGYFLSKNPALSSKIDSLYEYFPGCKILYMARNPLEVIPSILNMGHQIWHSATSVEASYPQQDKVYETAKYYYTYPLARLEQSPEDSYMVINYEDLVRQLSQVIQTIYQQFGFEITPKFSQILRDEDRKAKGYKSSHVYSLNQFRFTRKQIVSDLRSIFERFGFSTGQEK